MSVSGWVIATGVLAAVAAVVTHAVRVRTHPPLSPMAAPSTEPFPLRCARQAARERRLVWIRYRPPDGQVDEEFLEIYHATWTGQLTGWCRHRRRRRVIQTKQILAWRLLDERFEPVHNLEDWAKREGRTAQWQELREALRRR